MEPRCQGVLPRTVVRVGAAREGREDVVRQVTGRACQVARELRRSTQLSTLRCMTRCVCAGFFFVVFLLPRVPDPNRNRVFLFVGASGCQTCVFLTLPYRAQTSPSEIENSHYHYIASEQVEKHSKSHCSYMNLFLHFMSGSIYYNQI